MGLASKGVYAINSTDKLLETLSDPHSSSMDLTTMLESLLPWQSRHVNKETATADWLREYSPKHPSTTMPTTPAPVVVVLPVPVTTPIPASSWLGAELCSASLFGASLVLTGLHMVQ